MTYNKSLFQYMTPSNKTSVVTADGASNPVTGAGSIAFTPNLSLHNTLLMSSLSNRLLSVSQVTKQLDCCVLMYSTFCLLYDVHKKEIIGRGTKRYGLYYIDDVTPGKFLQTCSDTSEKIKKIMLWHNRLGNVSFCYLKIVVPSLFNGVKLFYLKCKSCILAKSHWIFYPPNMNKRENHFDLVHFDI